MIHLDSQAGEKDQILELLNHVIDNPAYELECLFNNSTNKFNPNITYNNFMSILKRYKNHPDYTSTTNSRLTIQFPESGKYNDVRVLVKGIGAINVFCNSDSLSGIMNSTDFEIKSRPKTRITRVAIPNYDIRFNLKEERNFNNDDAKIRDIQHEWPTMMKNYRYKKTFSFTKKTGDFQIDISIVKSSNAIDRFLTVREVIENRLLRSVIKPDDAKQGFTTWWKSIEDQPNYKVMVRGGNSYFKTIKESNVFNEIPSYEVEVEYIHNKTGQQPRFRNIETKKEYINKEFNNYFKVIGGVLQCIQGSGFILSNTEKAKIRKEYIKMVLDSIEPSMLETPNKSMARQIQQKRYQKDRGQQERQRPFQRGGNASINPDGDIIYNNADFQGNGDNGDDVDGETRIISGGGNYSEGDGDSNGEVDEGDNTGSDNGDDAIEEVDEIESGDLMKGGARKLAELRNRIEENFRRRGIFFGPLIVDLNHNNSSLIDPAAVPDPRTNTNIHINYVLTDKTDGERCLLYIADDGATYGIDRENNIKSFGIILPGLANSILDGEFINRTEDDKPLNNYYIFDAYIFKGRSVIHLPFLFNRPEGRHYCILESAKYFVSATNITQLNPRSPLLLFKKDYYPSDSAKPYAALQFDKGDLPLMSQNARRLLNKMNRKYGGLLEVGHLLTYKTDGLVFLPNNLGIFQNHEDDYIENPFKGSRWNNNYKWKPADHLTIDFKVKFVRELSNNRPIYQYINTNKYITVNLYSAVYQSQGGRSGTDNNNLNLYLLNSGLRIESIPQDFPFFAVDPFIGHFDADGKMQNNMTEALFLVDKNDNVICPNGEIIVDGLTVECSYNRTQHDEQHRWKPERIRPGKAANNYSTAVDTWRLINNPITAGQLSGAFIRSTAVGSPDEEHDPDSTAMKDIATVGGVMANITYYNANESDMVLLTDPLKKFNNFVKGMIINRALHGYVKPRLMDLAAGKLGDMHKYVSAGVSTLLGLEITYDGLNNRYNGAATRMMDIAKINPATAKLAERTMLIVGDATRNISNSDCSTDNLNKYYLDVLYGRAKGNTPKLKKMEGVALDGFDVITCMYAIHYMMNNESDLDNFLRNVSENLLDQGYFIGTCLDGMTILKEMGRQTEIDGEIDGKNVFFIRKLSDDPAEYKEITTGNKVSVFFETFAAAFPENLVNMAYLRTKAKEHNLKLIEYRTFLEEPGNLLSQFDATGSGNGKFAARIKQSAAMMMWAKFNAYFIFQKVRGDS